MALVTGYKCDVCPKQKAETNRWFIAFRRIPMKGGVARCCRFVVFDWTKKLAQQKGAIHICGEGCLSTFISRNTMDAK